ncbi:MAG: V-type ATP synthase subunit D [Clostridia bacterium]
MGRLNVNPTRMELNRLKKRLTVARRGHRLLKDKRDELMKRFIVIVNENKALREEMERLLMKSHENFIMARAIMPSENLEEALMVPKNQVVLQMGEQNIMSVRVPLFTCEEENASHSNIYPYGILSTSAQLDDSVYNLTMVFPVMLKLAEKEKTMQLIAKEIEKTRRRVNALEYIMIPQLNETIRYISMKLDENERGNITRLMKVKDMMIEEARRK